MNAHGAPASQSSVASGSGTNTDALNNLNAAGTSSFAGAEKRQVAESSFEFLFGALQETVAHGVPDPSSENGSELVNLRLDHMGYEVGYRLMERVAQRRVLPSETLEIIKFICKEFWTEVFKKQVDKLQTDHRGTFVLKDLNFRWLIRYSADASQENRMMVTRMLQFPCGMIRGALTNLGVTVTSVRAEYIDEKNVITLPCCSFTVKTK